MKAFVVNRRRTAPAPWDLDVESTVRDQLYGPRAEVTATPIRRDMLARVGARYRLLEPLGSGRTAEVHRARDERLQRDVAVKIIAEGSPTTGGRVPPEASEAAYRELLELVARGEIAVDVEVVPLSEVEDAWQRNGSDRRVVFVP